MTPVPYPVLFGMAGAFSFSAIIIVLGQLLTGEILWAAAIIGFIFSFAVILAIYHFLKKYIN
ncbi:hypothetical protein K8O68_05950 [Salipaludibacillus sp. CUR1]|nr:hypothetical protein [Salipaludibacillus sp. CUR1]MCE7791962.1 hypothetical protein [Salipaludibacillus sp. CUR1]